ncbi:hypothetical protein RFI_20573, partial [Reticulomyxa filosa]
ACEGDPDGRSKVPLRQLAILQAMIGQNNQHGIGSNIRSNGKAGMLTTIVNYQMPVCMVALEIMDMELEMELDIVLIYPIPETRHKWHKANSHKTKDGLKDEIQNFNNAKDGQMEQKENQDGKQRIVRQDVIFIERHSLLNKEKE